MARTTHEQANIGLLRHHLRLRARTRPQHDTHLRRQASRRRHSTRTSTWRLASVLFSSAPPTSKHHGARTVSTAKQPVARGSCQICESLANATDSFEHFRSSSADGQQALYGEQPRAGPAGARVRQTGVGLHRTRWGKKHLQPRQPTTSKKMPAARRCKCTGRLTNQIAGMGRGDYVHESRQPAQSLCGHSPIILYVDHLSSRRRAVNIFVTADKSIAGRTTLGLKTNMADRGVWMEETRDSGAFEATENAVPRTRLDQASPCAYGAITYISRWSGRLRSVDIPMLVGRAKKPAMIVFDALQNMLVSAIPGLEHATLPSTRSHATRHGLHLASLGNAGEGRRAYC